jgi:hypothetical protein
MRYYQLAGRRVAALLVLVVCAVSQALPATAADKQDPSVGDARRAQARALTAASKFDQALPLYDDLTASGSTDISLYVEAVQAAAAAHDMRRGAVYRERRLKVDPNDYLTRAIIPVAYRLAGDDAAAERSISDFIAYWKASKDPQVRSKPLLMIDQFRAGPWTVNVLQCMEIGGDFGVGYMFDVWGPKAPPLPPGEMEANHRERIVLEHNRLDQKIASEMSHQQAPMHPSLDALSANKHRTVQFFASEPSYAMMRNIVSADIQNDKDLATEAPLGGAWGKITCQTADK